SVPAHKRGVQTLRLNAVAAPEAMIAMAIRSGITKVSREFPRIYTYTARVEEAPPYWHSKLALQTELKALETSAMHKISSRFLPILAAIAVPLALAPVVHAQIQGSVTRITPVPDGASFS